MARIVYLVGRSVDCRQRLLRSKMASCKDHAFLHLVPTRGKVMDLEVDPPFWLRERIDTLTRIIHQIFEEHIRLPLFKSCRPIDDSLKSLLIKKILERRGIQPDGLTYFSPILSGPRGELDFPGVYRSISHFFSLLIRNNLQDRFVEDLAGRIIRLEEKAAGAGEGRYTLESDLTWLFGDFEEIKREIKGYDDNDVLASVRSYLKRGGTPQCLNDADILILDGFIQISRIEEDILFYLFHQVHEVWWLLDYDSQARDPIQDLKASAGREALWHWGDRDERKPEESGQHQAYRVFTSLVSLMERSEAAGFDSLIERASQDPFPNPVAGGLYFHGQMDDTAHENLRVKSFASRMDEVRAIAGEIKRIIHEDKLDASQYLGKIRVIFPELQDYSSLISEIFGSQQLPFSLTKGLSLSSHPLANIFRYILEIPLNQFKREDIFFLFSSPLIEEVSERNRSDEQWLSKLRDEHLLSAEDIPEPPKFIRNGLELGEGMALDIFLFDDVARKCGLNRLGADITGFWEEALLRVRDYYRDGLAHAMRQGERKALTSEYYRFLAQIALLRERLKPFKELTRQKSPQGILEGFFLILHMLGFPENIARIPEVAAGLESAVVRAMVKRDMKAYALLKDLMQASASEVRLARELFGIKDGYPLLSQFYATFRLKLNNAYLLDEPNPNVIRISEWLEIRGRSFEYIFAGGLTAESFPLREEVNFILPENPHAMFRRRDLMDESKHLCSHLLRNYRKRLYLSYPRYSDEKEVQPSPVLADLEAMVKSGLGPDCREETLEEVFRWEENPYFTSEEELLNGSRVKAGTSEKMKEGFFPLKRIIVKNDSQAENLMRGMCVLRCRGAEDGLFEYDGLVGGSVRFHQFLREKSEIFSPSQLETLANCPMRYLFEHIYGLKTLEELGAEVSGREMGQHLHAILRDFFERLKDDSKNVAEIGLERAFHLAREVAGKYFRKHPFLNKLEFFEFQKREFLAGLEKSEVRSVEGSKGREGIFAQLLRFEERALGNQRPKGVEFGFGQEGEAPVALGKTRIQGYVDRFDVMEEEEGVVHVYDYKTGRIPTAEMAKKGLSFQLAAYMNALRTELQVKGISAAFYALKREVFLKDYPLKQRMNDHWEGMTGLDISGVALIDEYVAHAIGLLVEGSFHHSADEEMCPYCAFKYACYKDMRRMKHLIQSGVNHHIYSGEKNLEKWERVDQLKSEWKTMTRSMQQALNLKTEGARRKHFEAVMDYGDWLRENGNALPFYADYIEELLEKIAAFQKRYQAS